MLESLYYFIFLLVLDLINKNINNSLYVLSAFLTEITMNKHNLEQSRNVIWSCGKISIIAVNSELGSHKKTWYFLCYTIGEGTREKKIKESWLIFKDKLL